MVKIGNPLDVFRIGAAAGGGTSPEAEKARTVPSASQSPPMAGENAATVTLSGALGALNADMKLDDAFSAERVGQIRLAIAEGTFKVNANVVADRMIAGNLEALARAKR